VLMMIRIFISSFSLLVVQVFLMTYICVAMAEETFCACRSAAIGLYLLQSSAF
jgi:hypothetical protein